MRHCAAQKGCIIANGSIARHGRHQLYAEMTLAKRLEANLIRNRLSENIAASPCEMAITEKS
jgi:hypothetical protein